MKRFRLLGCAILMSALFVGCGPETRESLVTATVQRTEFAATEVETITNEVKAATASAEKGNKLVLAKAGKAAEKLKDTGMKIVELRQSIDRVRSSITEDEKAEYAKNQKANVEKALKTLHEKRTQLREALAAAEKYDPVQVDELRKKITEAESPFEAQAR